jgi:hypothetical protein
MPLKTSIRRRKPRSKATKPSSQKERRRLKEIEWRRVRTLVWKRDKGRCIKHPWLPARTVNHILSRGAHPEYFLDIRNLACLCGKCDNDDTNTEGFVIEQFQILAGLHPEYDWTPFGAYLEQK